MATLVLWAPSDAGGNEMNQNYKTPLTAQADDVVALNICQVPKHPRKLYC